MYERQVSNTKSQNKLWNSHGVHSFKHQNILKRDDILDCKLNLYPEFYMLCFVLWGRGVAVLEIDNHPDQKETTPVYIAYVPTHS